jgi:hypothetical protein
VALCSLQHCPLREENTVGTCCPLK